MTHAPWLCRLALCSLAGLFALGGCGSGESKPETAAGKSGLWSDSTPVCGQDEVREYYCDELLPRQNALPAPEPFEACPGSIESHVGVLEPKPSVALFDADYTAHTRRRMPPGHSCCYSWCAPLKIAAREDIPPGARCDADHTMHESWCVDEPESGTSEPMAQPFDRCPAAVTPPDGAVYSAPKAAPFDIAGTQMRRQVGFKECCYAWCSKAPPTAVKIAKPPQAAPLSDSPLANH